jgi:seryl-tRNA synthetase
VQRLRDDSAALRQGALDKGEDPAVVDRAVALDERRRALLAKSDALKAERNTVSRDIGEQIRRGADPAGADVRTTRERSSALGREIEQLDGELTAAAAELEELLLRIPNPADPDVPVGGEEASPIVRTWGTPLAHQADGWTRRPHWEVGEALGLFDFTAAA